MRAFLWTSIFLLALILHASAASLKGAQPEENRGEKPSPEEREVDDLQEELKTLMTMGKHPKFTPRPRDPSTSTPLDYHSVPEEVTEWLRSRGFSEPTVNALGVLTGAQLFSLNKEELRAVCPEEGARVYSQIMVQKALLEDQRRQPEQAIGIRLGFETMTPL